ncbi:hypothetical protein CBQ26_12075 [Deinococcus indicus]|uniref:Uncharacterized protein n=1 Tax=Deinococcus indicus TaxID=223556 RepID=A0A246BJL0_9DEIO|nr:MULTISPECIES: hypothetical protein [Deinococcus]OOV12427.1 hypothetical protein BXU09_16655 [Deinococcus sp. LM3]OWL95491.1 hypothetical protein CBQ26_12075 [Deinococcus indicus]
MELLVFIIVSLFVTPMLILWESYNNVYYVNPRRFLPVAIGRVIFLPVIFLLAQRVSPGEYMENIAQALILTTSMALSYQLFAHRIHPQQAPYHLRAHTRARKLALAAFITLILVLPTALSASEVIRSVLSYGVMPSMFAALVAFIGRDKLAP